MKKTLFLLGCGLLAALGLQAQSKTSTQTDKVRYKMYLNYHEDVLPDFSTFGEADAEGVTDIFDLEGIPGENGDHYALLLEYDLPVKKADTFSFRLCSDDGSRLYIDDNLLLDLDGAHGPIVKEVSLLLGKGTHAVRVEYFEKWKSQSLSLFYKTPSTEYIALGSTVTAQKTPDFVLPQAKEAAQRLNAWKGKDEVVVFPILTDIHTCNRETYRHIGYIAELDKFFHYDFMVNLGDIGLNTEPAHSSKAFADGIIEKTRGEMAKFPGVFLYAPGNHDYDGGEGVHISSGELSDLFQKPSLPYANGNLHLSENNCWCYYDLPKKNMRLILLNSQNTETEGEYYYTYEEDQLEWLIKLLEETPKDFSVLVMGHFMPHPVGHWGELGPRVSPTTQILMEILSAYRNRTMGENGGLHWNFESAEGRLVGLFTGDSHVNALACEEGVNYFISQGYGKMENEELAPGQKRAWFNSRKTLCCDLIAIKPATGEVHTFRIGAGGADLDYLFSY